MHSAWDPSYTWGLPKSWFFFQVSHSNHAGTIKLSIISPEGYDNGIFYDRVTGLWKFLGWECSSSGRKVFTSGQLYLSATICFISVAWTVPSCSPGTPTFTAWPKSHHLLWVQSPCLPELIFFFCWPNLGNFELHTKVLFFVCLFSIPQVQSM